MADTTTVLTTIGWENTTPVVMARLTDATGAALTQASFAVLPATPIMYYVYDLALGLAGVVTDPGTALVVATVIFDVLQTGNGWTADTTGYNFRWVIPAGEFALAAGDKRYQVEIMFTLTTGEIIGLVALVERRNLINQVPP